MLNAGRLVAPAVVDAPCVLLVLIGYTTYPSFFRFMPPSILQLVLGCESLCCCVLGLVCVPLLAAATPTVLGHRGVSWADRRSLFGRFCTTAHVACGAALFPNLVLISKHPQGFTQTESIREMYGWSHQRLSNASHVVLCVHITPCMLAKRGRVRKPLLLMHGCMCASSLPFLLCMLLLLVLFQSWFCVALVCRRSAFTLAGCLNLNSPQHYAGCSLQLLLLRVPSAAVQTFQKGTEAQCALLALPVLGHRAGLVRYGGPTAVRLLLVS
jgi:hypothetical protein